jgi:lipopolysaccharide export system protein LptA
MPLPISQLRRWFALSAVAALLLVAGAYFYARHRVQNALKQVPERMGLGIQQSADGFTISRSDGPRTLFKIQASKAVKFADGGRAELHDVAITLYGRDSSRFDQIYGSEFEYDALSGDVVAKGEVQIDLEANPSGLASPDQTTPQELQNPIHLKTSGLTFNQKTGNAFTKERVDFHISQASGSAIGVSYDAKTGVLTLASQVTLATNEPTPTILRAARGVILKSPRTVVLEQAHLQSGLRNAQANQAVLYLRPDNTVERVQAQGDVQLEIKGPQPAEVHAAQLELTLANQRGMLRTAVFSGNVQAESGGAQPIAGSAGRAVLSFAANNVLTKVHTEDRVKLQQHQKASAPATSAQDLELTAAAVDLFLAGGRRLDHAETSGAAQIAIRPVLPASGQTLVTAGKFQARFNSLGQLESLHGAPATRIVSSSPGQPDRASTSQSLDAAFRPGEGIEAIVQQGSVAYSDGERKAWADRARYTPADQMLALTGAPRVVQGGMTTTARIMRLNRATGDAFSEGGVKSTYSDVQAQPDGALLSSSSPIHVTAAAMTVHRASAVALYTGSARLWQDANVVSAPVIEFDRDRRSVVARASSDRELSNGGASDPGSALGSTDQAASASASPGQSVSTVLVQTDKSGKVTPVIVTAKRLTYADSERRAHFEGGVIAKSADFSVRAEQMEVFLEPRSQATSGGGQTLGGTGTARLNRIVARNQVVVTQPTRRATGDQLVYTAAADKFVLTGGPPCIFDAEHGKITGVSLTLFRTDDRVLVEGSDTSPSVSQTRVAR